MNISLKVIQCANQANQIAAVQAIPLGGGWGPGMISGDASLVRWGYWDCVEAPATPGVLAQAVGVSVFHDDATSRQAGWTDPVIAAISAVATPVGA